MLPSIKIIGKNLPYLLVSEISSTQAPRSKQQIKFKHKMANICLFMT